MATITPLQRVCSALQTRWFVWTERQRLRRAHPRGLRLLFSDKDDRKAPLIRSFAGSGHHLSFQPLHSARLEDHDLVVPLTIEDQRWLSAHRKRLPSHHPLPIPSLAAVSLCDDKLAFNRWVLDSPLAGLIPPLEPAPTYPWVLKHRFGEWGATTHLVRHAADEAALQTELQNPDYFRQTFVPGADQYALHLVVRDGQAPCWLNLLHRFDHAAPIQGRDMQQMSTLSACPHLPQFVQLLNHVEFEGLCCIDYKVVDGQARVIEINPRFGGSLAPFFFSFLRHLVPALPSSRTGA